MNKLFSPGQESFIREHIPGTGNRELQKLVNKKFELNLKVSQIKRYKANHHLSSGLSGHFPKGLVPFNKGKKGVNGNSPTRFKKGHPSQRLRPIGSERIDPDGYTTLKVADHKWKMKHTAIWEMNNGPVPAGYTVIFGDRDKNNFDPDNLVLVSRKQLVIMNKNSLIKADARLTKVGSVIADLRMKIKSREKKQAD